MPLSSGLPLGSGHMPLSSGDMLRSSHTLTNESEDTPLPKKSGDMPFFQGPMLMDTLCTDGTMLSDAQSLLINEKTQ